MPAKKTTRKQPAKRTAKKSDAKKKSAAKKSTAKKSTAKKSTATRSTTRKKTTTKKSATKKATAKKPKLLSGGNPQIPMGFGDEPVQAYIQAMPGWKSDVGKCIDALMERHIPDVRKAVKWNSPFYGIEGQGWVANVHVFTKYVKLTFFAGPNLDPVPPGGTRDDGRWIDIYEGELDEQQLTKWIKQAAKLPGWMTSDIEG